MKKYFYTFAAAALCIGSVTLSACGEGGKDDKPVDTELTSWTIEVDKSNIEANNEDVATFIVRNQDGVDITNDTRFNVRIMDMSDNSLLKEPKATAFQNGATTYVARYNGKKSDNEITVTGQNRKNYEKYFRYIGVQQLTGEWCTYCPRMTKTLDGMTDLTDRMIRMAYHDGDPFAIPATNTIMKQFQVAGLPSGVIDYRKKLASDAENNIRAAIKESQRDYPALCGVKINTTLSADKKSITVTPEVTVTKAGQYAIAWVLLVDNIDGKNQSSGGEGYKHNHTVLVSPESPVGGFINGGKEMVVGEPWTPSAAEQAAGFTSTLPNYPVEDMRVVVYVLNETSPKTFSINNLNVCKAGESVDYRLND